VLQVSSGEILLIFFGNADMKKSHKVTWYSVVAAVAVMLFPALCLALVPMLPAVKALELAPPNVKPVKAIELPPPNLKPVAAHELRAVAAVEAPYGNTTTRATETQVAINTPPILNDSAFLPPPVPTAPAERRITLDVSKGSAAADYNPLVY